MCDHVDLPKQLADLDLEFERILEKKRKATEYGASDDTLKELDGLITELKGKIAQAFVDEAKLEIDDTTDRAINQPTTTPNPCQISVILMRVTYTNLPPGSRWLLDVLVEGGSYGGPIRIHVSPRLEGNGSLVRVAESAFSGTRGTCPGTVLLDFDCTVKLIESHFKIVNYNASATKTYECPSETQEKIEVAAGIATFAFEFRVNLRCEQE